MVARIITGILFVCFLTSFSILVLAGEGGTQGPPARPPGWDEGKKEGWSSDVPPGLEKGKKPGEGKAKGKAKKKGGKKKKG